MLGTIAAVRNVSPRCGEKRGKDEEDDSNRRGLQLLRSVCFHPESACQTQELTDVSHFTADTSFFPPTKMGPLIFLLHLYGFDSI